MGRAGVGTTEFWLGQYEGKKPLGRHTRLQDNMKTGCEGEGVDWIKLA
jgi:hypothetical protein